MAFSRGQLVVLMALGVLVLGGLAVSMWQVVLQGRHESLGVVFNCTVNGSLDYDSGCVDQGGCWNTATVVIGINGTLYTVEDVDCGLESDCSQVFAPGVTAACSWTGPDNTLDVSYDFSQELYEADHPAGGWIILGVVIGVIGLAVVGGIIHSACQLQRSCTPYTSIP